jgi:hypothetical protein
MSKFTAAAEYVLAVHGIDIRSESGASRPAEASTNSASVDR